ncbi:MAG: tetratricopeptide repeat protein [Chloroflexi bacterium]|nr:tetratricopeptide repeat protein [Chloroflexota bacterium]
MTIPLPPEEKARFRRLRSEQAVQLAMQQKWDEAIAVNKAIVDVFPDDVEAYNRLGKAYLETGRLAEAREAYQKALTLDPNNAIARRNLTRLQAMKDETITTVAVQPQVDANLFIEETGKTGVTTLVNTAPREELATLTAGEPVLLKVEGKDLKVLSTRNEYLGQVEPRLALRLIRLMQGGNQYAAAVTSLTDDSVEIIIRETFQHPTQVGKVSFPTRGGDAGFRPYIRDSVLRYDVEEEEESFEEGEFAGEWEEEPEAAVVDEVSLELEGRVVDKDDEDDYEND